MALTIANRKNMKSAWSVSQMTPGTHGKGAYGTGGNQPPKKRIVALAHMVAIATYSPSMNIVYGGDPYSPMKPGTRPDSASTRSNGGRFVSARAERKNTTNIGNSGSQYQLKRPYGPSCAFTIAERFNEPAHSSTVISTKPIETS